MRIVYLGRLSRTKGEHALSVIDACGELLEIIPNLELTVVGTGSRLHRVRREAARLNEKAQRLVVQVVGSTRHTHRFIRAADIVVGAAYSALEGLACHRTVIGLGFAGLFGTVTAENICQAIAANFGDTGARWPEVDSSLIASQIVSAYEQGTTDDGEWVEAILDEQFAVSGIAEQLETVFGQAMQHY